MTLALLLTEYAELVGDTIATAGQDVDRVLRYHGHAPPEDLECGSVLAVWWEGPSLTVAGEKCGGPPTVNLAAKWITCWKIADVKRNSTILLWDATWDATSAVIADVAEAVARRLIRLQCIERGDPMDPPEEAVMALVRSPRFVGVTPTGASGGAAGVIWRVTAQLAQQIASSEPVPEPQAFFRTVEDSVGMDNPPQAFSRSASDSVGMDSA